MSTRHPFIRPFPLLVALVALFIALTPLAFAADARLVVDPAVYDVRADTAAPTNANVRLAFNGSAFEVHVVKSGGNLPAINLGFSGATPRIDPHDQVDLAQAIRLSPRLQTMIGGVMIQHRNTTQARVMDAYVAALGELGFSLQSNGSNGRTWTFSNGTASVRVNVAPQGRHVAAYIGR